MIVCRTVKYKGENQKTVDVSIQQNIVTVGKRRFPFLLFGNLNKITNNLVLRVAKKLLLDPVTKSRYHTTNNS